MDERAEPTEITVECGVCGLELDAAWAILRAVLVVEPCDNCLAKAEDAGRALGPTGEEYDDE
jgi:hypothetical protein